MGRATAELVAHRTTSIRDVAEHVRETFRGIPEIASLPDALAFALSPAALTSLLWDPARLQRRVRAVLNVMSRASEVSPGWLASTAEVANAILDGHRKLSEQVGALGFILRSGAPRKQLLLNATTVYERFSEGPMRKFGAIVRQAIEVSEGRQQVLDARAVVEDKFGYVTDSLKVATPALVHDLETLVRNAAAHYEFEITESGVDITEPARGGKKRAASLTDDDFLEMLFDLNEAIVALEAGLLVYASSDPALQAEFDQVASGIEERFEIIRALAGLAGWVEMSFAMNDAHLEVEGRDVGDANEDPFVRILPTLAAVAGSFPQVQTIEIRLRGTERTCRYDRTFFEPSGSNDLISASRAGRAMAKVLFQTQPEARVQSDARYLLVGPVATLIEAVAANKADFDSVREFCSWIIPLLKSEDLSPELLTQRDEIVEHLSKLTESIAASRFADRRGDRRMQLAAATNIRRHAEKLSEPRLRLRNLYP